MLPGFPPPFRVGLIVTEQCNAECAHCWFECTLNRGATMSRYDAEYYINKAVQTGSVKWISLTGGEPMLHPSLVEDFIAYASEKELRTELVTNAFWATSREQAEGTLARLRDAGLDVLNVSADDFHQSTIPFERVQNCYESAKRLGIKTVVMTTLKKSSHIDLTEVSRLFGEEIERPGPDPPRGSVIGLESGFIPVGRGASIPSTEWHLEGSPLTGGCEAVLRDIGVRTNGEVMPCCSASSSLPGFSIGNLSEWDLGEVLEKAWKSDVFKALSEKGPTGLTEALPDDIFVNKCHLCCEVLKTLLDSQSKVN